MRKIYELEPFIRAEFEEVSGKIQAIHQKEKTEQELISETLSGRVPMTGTFPNQFLEGMRQIYELEPFIKLEPHLTNQWGKAGGSRKKAI